MKLTYAEIVAFIAAGRVHHCPDFRYRVQASGPVCDAEVDKAVDLGHASLQPDGQVFATPRGREWLKAEQARPKRKPGRPRRGNPVERRIWAEAVAIGEAAR